MATHKTSVSSEGVARREIEGTLHLELIPGTEVMTDGVLAEASFKPKNTYHAHSWRCSFQARWSQGTCTPAIE